MPFLQKGTDLSSPFSIEEASISPSSQSGIYSSDLSCHNIGENSNSNGQLAVKTTSINNSFQSDILIGGKSNRRGPGRPRKDILVQAPATGLLTETVIHVNRKYLIFFHLFDIITVKASRRGGGSSIRIVKREYSIEN